MSQTARDCADPSQSDRFDRSQTDAQGSPIHDEIAAVRERYARRSAQDMRYSLLDPAALLMVQERQRLIAGLFARLGWHDLANRRLLEVGCGTGVNLLEFLRLGFSPEYLQGIELLESRAKHARTVLPASLRIDVGDAATIDVVEPESQDVVYQATVFSSLLDDDFQQRLADAMWRLVRPGGGVLWYDFTVNNPNNPDVRGVSVARVRELFPRGEVEVQRITLAPPIARAAARLSPRLYTVLNACSWLRTHVLAWAGKNQ
jgi:SAM-dependent methyltransferase